MEVSGKRKPQNTFSVSHGSEEDFLLFCIPCDRDGIRMQAKGFCINCNEHLCEACCKHHKKQTPSFHHTLLDQDAMPVTMNVPIKQDDFNSCHDHVEEKLKYYCRDHDAVVCSICATLNHKICKVEYIPKLSKHILDSEELNELITEMKKFEYICITGLNRAKDRMKAITQNHQKILKEIHQFRKEINTRLDEIEKHAVKKAESVLLQHETILDTSSTSSKEIKDELVEKQKRLDYLIQRNCLNKLFAEMIDGRKRLDAFKKRQEQDSTVENLQNMSFVKNQNIVDLLSRHYSLGDLMVDETVPVIKVPSAPSKDKTLDLKLVDEIMSSSLGEKKVDIPGIEVIQQAGLIVCDYLNKKVKYYDTVQKTIFSEIHMSKEPFDVAVITDDKFAVTVPDDRMICFVSFTNKQITSDLQININERCFGIAYSRDKLFVSCIAVDGKVLVLDVHGKILQSFGEDDVLFKLPLYYITINENGTSFYVSDRGEPVKAVQQLDCKGKVTNTFQPAKGGKNLRDICELNDGTFLVCLNQDNADNLVRISEDCKTCKMTTDEMIGSWFPKAIAYCKKTRMLYVSFYEKKRFSSLSFNNEYRIKVFQVDWC